jgi:signal peptidase
MLVTACIVGLAATLILGRFFGLSSYVVMSGSMEPELAVGSLIFVAPERSSDIRPGDVVTFALTDRVVTHRVVEVRAGARGPLLVTKGDANLDPDAEPVQVGPTVGVPRVVVPELGFAVIYVQSYWRVLTLLLASWLVLSEGARRVHLRLHPLRGAPA